MRPAEHDVNDALSARDIAQVIDSLGLFCFMPPVDALLPDFYPATAPAAIFLRMALLAPIQI
jgi:hypothetical protein